MTVRALLACVLALMVIATGAPSRADAPGAAASDEAATLLAKHTAYVGWSGGDGRLKTLRASGEATRNGTVVRRFERSQIGLLYRASGNGGSGSFEQGFTGRVFWQTNDNGFTTPATGEIVRFLLTNAALSDEQLGSLPGTVQGSQTIDGVSTRVVRVTTPGGVAVDLATDPADGEWKRIVVDPGGKYEQTLDVLAYTDVGGGKRVLSSWRLGGSTTVYTYTKIEANVDVNPDELHPPKAVASWTFGPPATAVPIAVTDKRIFIDAVVNGHPGRFIFDTGAGLIAFTDSFARLAGAKRVGQTYLQGIGGGARANIYSVDTIALGPHTLHDVRIATGLDERRGEDDGGHVDGYIGFDLLAGAIVDMDLDAQSMRIFDPAVAAPDRTQGITLRVDLSTGQPRIPMTVGGHASVLATIDSGDTFYALFSSKLVSAQHVKFFTAPDSLAARIEFIGVNGNETDSCGQLQSLEIGAIVYRPVPACMSDSMSFNDIIVGFDFFKNLNVVFDYPDGEILVSARKSH